MALFDVEIRETAFADGGQGDGGDLDTESEPEGEDQ
jgi:hypothetical protein